MLIRPPGITTSRCRGERQCDCKDRADPGLALAFDFSVVRVNDRLRDREAEPPTLCFNQTGLADAEKPFENARNVLFIDADSLILEANPDSLGDGQRDSQVCAGG